MGCHGVPLPSICRVVGVFSSLCLLCGFLTPSGAQEVNMAGGKENILLKGVFFS